MLGPAASAADHTTKSWENITNKGSINYEVHDVIKSFVLLKNRKEDRCEKWEIICMTFALYINLLKGHFPQISLLLMLAILVAFMENTYVRFIYIMFQFSQ